MFTHRIFRGWSRVWLTRDIIFPFAATRVALTFVALFGFRLLPLPSAFPLSWEIGLDGSRHPTSSGVPSAHSLVNMWSRWDSGWYLEIAKLGYHYNSARPSSTAFFPLYPLAIRALHSLFFLPHSDYWYLVTGIIVSNICLLAAAIYLYRLVRVDYPGRLAARAVLFLLVFPTSFFLSAAYSESMFLWLTLSAFYYARKERWLIASSLAGLAVLCRSQGIVLAVPLLVEYFAQRRFDFRRPGWELSSLLVIPVALFGLAIYFKAAFGSWTILFDSQKPWGRRLLAPWLTIDWVITHASPRAWLDFSFFGLLVAIAILGARELRLSYTVYLVMAAVFFSSWGMFGSVPRFVVVVFPLFIVLSLLADKSQACRVVSLTLCSVAGAIFFFMHSQWNWVA